MHAPLPLRYDGLRRLISSNTYRQERHNVEYLCTRLSTG